MLRSTVKGVLLSLHDSFTRKIRKKVGMLLPFVVLDGVTIM